MYSYINGEEETGFDAPSYADSQIDVEENKKEVQDILKDIEGLKQRLEEIRKKCRHSDKELKFVKVHEKQEVRWICSVCTQVVGYANPGDIKRFLK